MVAISQGRNFTDPNKFTIWQIVSTSLGVQNGTVNETAEAATFHIYVNDRGVTSGITFSNGGFNTLLNATSTTKGEVLCIYGPTHNTIGATSFRLTRDGAAAVTIIVSVSVGNRAMLTTGTTLSTATAPFNEFQNSQPLNAAKNTLQNGVAGNRYLQPLEPAKRLGTPLFEFSNSLLVEVASTCTFIPSNTAKENTMGMMYRTLMG